MFLRLVQQFVHVVGIEQRAITRRLVVQRILDELQAPAAQVLEFRHREIAFRPVDDRIRDHLPGHLLEHVLAPAVDLVSGRYARGELDQLVIQERHPGLETPCHRHVVHALDGVVHEHHGGI